MISLIESKLWITNYHMVKNFGFPKILTQYATITQE